MLTEVGLCQDPTGASEQDPRDADCCRLFPKLVDLMPPYSYGGGADTIAAAVKSLEEMIVRLRENRDDLGACAATLDQSIARLEPVQQSILRHPHGALLRDTYRRLAEVIGSAVQMAKGWKAAANRADQSSSSEAAADLQGALFVVNAAWAAFENAYNRMPVSGR